MVCPQCGTLNPDGRETCFRCERSLIRVRLEEETRCRWHPEAIRVTECILCGAPMCEACAIRIEDMTYCRNCAAVPGEEKEEGDGVRLLSSLDVSAYPCAALGWRFLAGLIDGAILGAAAIVLALAIWLLTGTPPGMPWTDGVNLLFWSILFVGAGAYFTAYLSDSGQTPGYGATDLLLTRADGNALAPAAAILRFVVSLFSAAFLMLGYLWILWDPKRQAWHDKVSGTLVLRTAEGRDRPEAS